MYTGLLARILNGRMRSERLSEREVARQTGLSNVTINRVCKGEIVDLKTILILCEWLDVQPSMVLDSFLRDDSSQNNNIVLFIENNPYLKHVLSNLATEFNNGQVGEDTIKSICDYIAFMIGHGLESRQEAVRIYTPNAIIGRVEEPE